MKILWLFSSETMLRVANGCIGCIEKAVPRLFLEKCLCVRTMLSEQSCDYRVLLRIRSVLCANLAMIPELKQATACGGFNRPSADV
jgi:hypothetical protein